MSEEKRPFLLIDGDIILYSVGFACEEEPFSHCAHSAKKLLQKMFDRYGIEGRGSLDYRLFFSGKENFRDEAATLLPYKGNRLDAPKPKHYEELKEYLCKHYTHAFSKNCEADDDIGLCGTDTHPLCYPVICSLDKDLDMIAGVHYNWRKDKEYEIDQLEADRNFIRQLLTGDATDNIPGLYKIAGRKAMPAIKKYCCMEDGGEPSFVTMVNRVFETYREALYEQNKYKEGFEGLTLYDCSDLAREVIDEIGTLLWIRRSGYETWQEYFLHCKENESS